MATKKLTFNNVEYDIDMDKLSDAIAALEARINEVKHVTIILERDYTYDTWRYNGEEADGNFIYECLTSGGTVLLNQADRGKVMELTSWNMENGVLNLYTSDGSVGGTFTVSV